MPEQAVTRRVHKRDMGKSLPFKSLRPVQLCVPLCSASTKSGKKTEDLQTLYEDFVCMLYRPKGSTCSDLNNLKYILFAQKALQSDYLLPTKDAFCQHLRRANYQAAVWCRALEARPSVPSPSSHGWQLVDNALAVHWMQQKPAPDELLLLSRCRCQTGCASARCSCRRFGLQCTDAWKCNDCENVMEAQINTSECESGQSSDDIPASESDSDDDEGQHVANGYADFEAAKAP